MSSTRHVPPEPTIKVEQPLIQLDTLDSASSDSHIPRKRARGASEMNDTKKTKSSASGRVKAEEVAGVPKTCDHCSKSTARGREEGERRLAILKEAILMKDAIIEQNESLASELRRTRHELHRMRTLMGSAGIQLQEEAARRFRGIDSDTASEDELEDVSGDVSE
ncbi:hypothetical protein B0H14DRAFT_3452535 [Mycena olivaceomarginata]|nr:hypothetical protein B0H14DRAFT_3452535 [Mycena olivaceomarginata]